MKKYICAIVVLVLAVSCKKELVEKPENLIEKDKMVEILYDISLMYASKGVNVGQIDYDRLTMETYIYERYGVDSTQVANSTIYYSSDPEEYLAMYEEIERRLKAEKDTIIERRKAIQKNDTLSSIEKMKADSLERERELREYIDTQD